MAKINSLRVGVARYSMELVKEVLCIPEGLDILDIFVTPEKYGDELVVRLTGNDLPESNPGDLFPEIRIEVSTRSVIDKIGYVIL